ncbi:MAG: histidine kinase [Spirochaetes bacterium]|nr:MAG: histidine kinase [Spirochaetota bacterium]
MGNMEIVIAELKNIDTFAELSYDDLSALAEICTPVHYPPRDIIAREGVDASDLFAFIKGSVGIWVDYDTEKADLLAVRDAPCLVGEMSVADQLPRSATIIAGPSLSGYSIDADLFRSLLEKRGSIALSLMKGISRLVRLSNNSFVSELRASNAELLQANKELKAAHKQLVRQERLSSLGKFSSMIIHDLRNPLSVIRGYADLLELKLEGKSENLHKYATQIRRETSRLSGLTSEWLDYSRGEIRLSYTPVKMEKLFEQLKESIEPGLKAKNLDVSWNIDFEGTVLLDLDRMLRVLVNLSDNARKACKRGDSIAFTASSKEGHLLIKIADSGDGMDKETLNHVFEPFYSTSDRGGTGLGMHIVKTVVEAHEGSVDISSKLGVGTTITISLPLRL